jgi:signal transduction histidine kinase
MSLPPLNTNKMLLESSVTRAFNNYHRLAYAHIGPDLTIIQTSDNFSSLLPGDMETAEGKPLIEVIEEFGGAEAQLRAVINKEQETFLLEYVNRQPTGGTDHYFNFRIAGLDTFNGPPGLLLIIEDVTTTGTLEQELAQHRNDLRQAQEELSAANSELQQLNQFKSFLISMLAHDMRTPLAAIRGYAELLLRLINSDRVEVFSTKAIAFADNICNITDQMTWLIRDIIDLDQSEKGLLTIILDNCDIHTVIHNTIEMVDSIIRLQNITLLLELEPPELMVAADPQRMRQITNNLIGNAIKYTPSGGEISITTHIEDGEAVLVVADNGRGMTAEQTEKVFQPYYRTQEAKSSNALGSGLGLFIVKSLVEAQNGRVDVTSEVGRGSIFTVYLPLAQSHT